MRIIDHILNRIHYQIIENLDLKELFDNNLFNFKYIYYINNFYSS